MSAASLRTKFRRDGSVTYWSVYDQAWRTSWYVPARELAAMNPKERERVLRHLRRHGPKPNPENPRDWWERCTRAVKKSGSAKDPNAVCGAQVAAMKGKTKRRGRRARKK
jgi:hypothetical protein